MRRSTSSGEEFADHLWPWVWSVLRACSLIAFLLVSFHSRAGTFRIVEATDLRIPIYAQDSTSLSGLVRIERVFTEERRVGFFRVKLLPVSVIAGMRVEMTGADANTNWLSGFRLPTRLVNRRNHIEWRDVAVAIAGEPRPRLEAGRIRPPNDSTDDHLLLENVTLRTGAGVVRVPKAVLRLRGQPGTITWREGDEIRHWDLFARPLNNNNKPEKGTS